MNDLAFSGRRPTPRLIVGLFALLFGALALGYFLFLRADYVAVFTEVRPADAAAIVAQLDSKKIAYRLGDGGATILVPADQADTARLAIAGSDVALKGGVGFELFNKSDMGLTDFAQRINYQRALQGELERSIMMIEEVDTARVHLAMPERTIFRSERNAAKAAVELVIKPGRAFDEARVAGVQRLVSFAVPDLAPADVVVLDGNGRTLSQASASTGAEDQTFLSPDAEERQGVQGYFRARTRAALQQALPGIETDVRVMALTGERASGGADISPMPPASAEAGAGTAHARNFKLRVIVMTDAPLSAEDTAVARSAVSSAVALDEAAGDELIFQVGLASRVADASPLPAPASRVVTVGEGPVVAKTAPTPWFLWIAGGVLLLVGGAFYLPRARAPRLSPAEREAMVERVRAALRSVDGGSDQRTADA